MALVPASRRWTTSDLAHAACSRPLCGASPRMHCSLRTSPSSSSHQGSLCVFQCVCGLCVHDGFGKYCLFIAMFLLLFIIKDAWETKQNSKNRETKGSCMLGSHYCHTCFQPSHFTAKYSWTTTLWSCCLSWILRVPVISPAYWSTSCCVPQGSYWLFLSWAPCLTATFLVSLEIVTSACFHSGVSPTDWICLLWPCLKWKSPDLAPLTTEAWIVFPPLLFPLQCWLHWDPQCHSLQPQGQNLLFVDRSSSKDVSACMWKL